MRWLLLPVMLAGCAPVALSPAGAKVEVMPAPRPECALVAPLRGSAGYNGRAGDENAADVERFLRNQAAERGADAMVFTSRRRGAIGEDDAISQPRGASVSGGCPNCVTMTANAYRCASPRAAAPPTAGDPPFAEAAGKAALAAAAESAKACAKPDARGADATVKVTFATTGDVVYAEVQGEAFENTGVGACIARKFRNAHVPAFAGEARSLTATVRLAP